MTFVEQIAPIIVKEAKERGYAFPAAIIAQAVLESGNGKSQLAAKYCNYFGLKCGPYWRGRSVNMTTHEEYIAGCISKIRDDFRVYQNMTEGVKGYFDFISTSRYANLKTAKSTKNYLEMIKSDGYATSKTYVANLMKVVDKYNLEMYNNTTEMNNNTVPAVAETVDIEKLARDVIAGKLGNGAERKAKLGSNYDAVQKRVNQILKGR